MPTKPKKPCGFPGCPQLTHDRYCEEHTKVMNARYNKYERTYDSSERYGTEWRRIRNRYIKAHPLCEKCLESGLLVPTEEVHHKVPLAEGGTHNRANLISLCKSCHARIHAARGDRWKGN